MKKRKLRMTKYPITMISLILFVVVSCSYIFTKDQLVSAQEQRNLQQIPTFSISSWFHKDYQNDVRSYLQDQLPARDRLFKTKVKFEHKLGKTHFADVWIGKNDMLFQDPVLIGEQSYKDHIDLLERIKKKYDMPMRVMLVPNKAVIYRDNVSPLMSYTDQMRWLYDFNNMLNRIDIQTVSLFDTLSKHQDEPMYFNTDHHWTSEAAYYAFEDYYKQFLSDQKKAKYDTYTIANDFYGSLAKRSGYQSGKPDTITIKPLHDPDFSYVVTYVEEQVKKSTVYDLNKAKSNNPYEVFFGGNHARIDIDTTSDQKTSLLILKDSYANAFIPYLLPYYSKITVIDPRYYNDDIDQLMKDRKVDEMLCLYNFNTFFQDASLYELFE